MEEKSKGDRQREGEREKREERERERRTVHADTREITAFAYV